MAKHRDPHLDWSTVAAELEAQQYGDEGWGRHRHDGIWTVGGEFVAFF